jgi:arylsulfatase
MMMRSPTKLRETHGAGISGFAAFMVIVFGLSGATAALAQELLPFPEPPFASTAGKTLADSKHQWRQASKHFPADAPNIVIFMTDDVGFSNPSTFGWPVNTPTLDRLAASGISYNAFHTTVMC